MVNLAKLITDFGIQKAEFDKIKKATDKMNSEIKDIFISEGIEKFDEADCDYTASMTTVNNDKVNESALISALKSLVINGDISKQQLNKIVKTKEYIDQDALEDAMYNGKVPATTIGACIEHKDPTYRLTVKRRK